jgi:hypothetical protein
MVDDIYFRNRHEPTQSRSRSLFRSSLRRDPAVIARCFSLLFDAIAFTKLRKSALMRDSPLLFFRNNSDNSGAGS